MSVLGNWHRELTRFAPELSVHVHHGLERPQGERFLHLAQRSDVVVTTYALVTRDKELLNQVEWRRVVLDEAQHIKNPPTKQTAAIRALRTRFRIALTGTPVENRLSELWSIMEFCCPGYLGTQADFRKRFALPVERHRDKRQAERLRQLVRPFILRRLKTDPNVISDLPPLVETRQQIPLTPEQASLYEQVVNDMLKRVDQAEGIRRRGLVLSALVKLKQICNHPAHFLREGMAPAAPAEDEADGTPEGESAEAAPRIVVPKGIVRADRLSGRSGKSIRLLEMLEELVAAGDRALIFTQYRQMGHLLVQMIRQDLDVEALFLHGGTPQAKRDQLVQRFQSEDPAVPIFVLSLKAGGVGLNLTAANHVFHYDRWWNPAVENQATDRAFRIGQLRTVNVHKMITVGTLEERIDQMIEQKTELASQIIGSGEQWLTELNTSQLRDLLSLRGGSVEEAA
jgi:SNF2 family DNA or RNA helicase